MAQNPSGRVNLFWVELVRVVVIFGVVIVHTAADVVTEWGNVPQSEWWAGNLWDSLVRGCVPVFIMLSGALLLPKQESLGEFFDKRLGRVLIPFIAWTVLYLLWKKAFYEPDLTFGEGLRRAAGDRVHFHLWFLYVIIGLYLVTPVFRIFAAHASRRDLIYFLALWFVIASLLPFTAKIAEAVFGAKIRFHLPAEPAQGFIGYFILGHFLRKYAQEFTWRAALAVWLASYTACAAGTYFLSAHSGASQIWLYGNMMPNVVFYSAAFFILMMQAGPALEKKFDVDARKFITHLSAASFGIYLVHPMVLEALEKGRLGFRISSGSGHPAYMVPVFALIIYALSSGIVLVLQKIPGLRRII